VNLGSIESLEREDGGLGVRGHSLSTWGDPRPVSVVASGSEHSKSTGPRIGSRDHVIVRDIAANQIARRVIHARNTLQPHHLVAISCLIVGLPLKNMPTMRETLPIFLISRPSPLKRLHCTQSHVNPHRVDITRTRAKQRPPGS
jgi:hypothetical protein